MERGVKIKETENQKQSKNVSRYLFVTLVILIVLLVFLSVLFGKFAEEDETLLGPFYNIFLKNPIKIFLNTLVGEKIYEPSKKGTQQINDICDDGYGTCVACLKCVDKRCEYANHGEEDLGYCDSQGHGCLEESCYCDGSGGCVSGSLDSGGGGGGYGEGNQGEESGAGSTTTGGGSSTATTTGGGSSTATTTGGGSSTASKIYAVSKEDFKRGISINLKIRDRIKFVVSEEDHYIIAVQITVSSLKISVTSDLQEAVLSIGERREFDVNDDNYSDLYVNLNGISDNEANVTVKEIPRIVREVPPLPVTQHPEDTSKKEEPKSRIKNILLVIIGITILLIIIVTILLIIILYKKTGKKSMELPDIRKKVVAELPDNKEVDRLLSDGNKFLEAGDYKNARKTYKEIKRMYNPKQDKERIIYKKIVDFYNNILRNENSQ